ncbi:hypothetical protein NEAUS04_0446 [Nematocida ausubeli]|nr:hypothetical protein NEAUS04_0446 [Nematocida ausubeli]
MINPIKIAALSYIFLTRVRAEATYFDSSFELNKSGYIYSIGAEGYVGYDPKDKVQAKILEDARTSMRFRTFLSGEVGDAGFIFMQDKGFETPEGEERFPSQTEMHGKLALKICRNNSPVRVILDSYDGSNHFNFFVTPPVLLNENGFHLMVGEDCIMVDKETKFLVASVCHESTSAARNYQLFSWVDSSTFNRGIDPVTYRPNPSLYNPNEVEDHKKEKECKKHRKHKIQHSHLKNTTNLAFDKPYRPADGRSQLPTYCDH